MFKNPKKQKILLTSLLLLAISPFFASAQALPLPPGTFVPSETINEDPYLVPGASDLGITMKSVISRNLEDPSENSNESPAADGLPQIPGIPLSSTYSGDDPARLDVEAEKFTQKRTDLENVINQLLEKKAEAQKDLGWWNYIKSWSSLSYITGSTYGEAKAKVGVIDRMIQNAREKHRVVEANEIGLKKRAQAIRTMQAEDNGTIQEKEVARQAMAETMKNVVNTRKKIVQEIANEKALVDASCWPKVTEAPNIKNCILIGTGWVGNIITWVFALLLWVASKIFDLSIYYSISLIHSWFTLPAVATVWKICRDLANICFVFVLLYIAIGTVFELEGIKSPSRMIVNVVIIALLVNFSGFFTRVIIDASNVIAYEFYSQMGGGGAGMNTIGTKLVQKMKLGSYFLSSESLTEAKTKAGQEFDFIPPTINRLSFIGIIGQTLGNVLIILVTSFVLLAASAMFLIRTIYLLFLYIFSPLAFVSQIIPNNKYNFFSSWMDKLVNQSFFAPAFLIPLYVVFVLFGEGGIVSLSGGTGSYFNIAGELSLVMVNVIIIGLLFGCLKIATDFGAVGAKMANGLASRWSRNVGWGALGMAGGYTIGRTASRLANSQRMQAWASSANPIAGRVAMGARRTLGAIGNSNFGTGTQSYNARVSARQRGQQERAASFTGPNAGAQRASYMSRLLTAGDRDAYYRSLSAEDKATVEQQLRAQGRGDEANRLLASGSGRQARESTATAWRGLDPGDRDAHVNFFDSISADQDRLDNLYEGLNPRERADMRQLFVGGATPAEVAQNLVRTALIDASDTRFVASPRATAAQRGENARERGRVERTAEATNQLAIGVVGRPRLAVPTNAFNPAWAAANPAEINRINALRNLAGQEFTDFASNNNLFDGTNTDLYPYLTGEQLRSALSMGVPYTERQIIRTEIEANRPGPGPHPDRTLENAYQYLNNPTQGGGAF